MSDILHVYEHLKDLIQTTVQKSWDDIMIQSLQINSHLIHQNIKFHVKHNNQGILFLWSILSHLNKVGIHNV